MHSLFFEAAKLKLAKSTKLTHLISGIFQKANVTFITKLFNYKSTIILKLAEPAEKTATEIGIETFPRWSNVAKYPYFPSKKLRRS